MRVPQKRFVGGSDNILVRCLQFTTGKNLTDCYDFQAGVFYITRKVKERIQRVKYIYSNKTIKMKLSLSPYWSLRKRPLWMTNRSGPSHCEPIRGCLHLIGGRPKLEDQSKQSFLL